MRHLYTIFISGLLLLGTIGGVILLRDNATLPSTLTGVPDPKAFAASRATARPTAKPTFIAKGVKHESNRNRRNDAPPRPRQKHSIERGETTPGSFESDQTIPSIYSEASTNSSVAEGIEDSDTRAERESIAPQTAPGPALGKVALGVPLDAWVKSKKHQLPTSRPVADTAGGMRLLLWCMEMKKKGPEYLGDRECEGLLARNQEKAFKTTY